MKKMTDKVYVVCATGIEMCYMPSHEVYNHANKTRTGAEKIFLNYLEDFYGKDGLEEIRQEYPDEFNRMLEKGYYQCGCEAWSDDDEEASEGADFQLNTLSIQALEIGE